MLDLKITKKLGTNSVAFIHVKIALNNMLAFLLGDFFLSYVIPYGMPYLYLIRKVQGCVVVVNVN